MKESLKGRGMVKVFLSSTFRDLKEMRKSILDRLVQALDAAAMENFISTGEKSQTETLRELRESKIAIFLISPYYGSDIKQCECMENCRANCSMKDGTERISYTLCEHRVAKSEHKLLMPYLIDEGWNLISEDGAPKVWNLRKEVEKDLCPRIEKNEKGVEKVLTDLFINIIYWYSTGEINLEHFCGRRDLLKELMGKMRKSINVYGVGGIGKTTICEVALLLCRLVGRKVYYVGSQEAYASGTGYWCGEEILQPNRVTDLTVDDISHALGLGTSLVGLDIETKMGMILHILDRERTILFIDDFKGDEGIKELIRKGNGLQNGCIIVSSKQEVDTASFRIPVENIEEAERGTLIEIMASSLGKKIEKDDAKKIGEIAEGHPVATYVLISNIGRVPVQRLAGFKEGLDFSRDDDVKEYMNRVIKSGISAEAYELLENLSVIEENLDVDSILDVSPEIRIRIGELVDASILERKGSKYQWKYHQIREAVFEDSSERHRLAMQYYKKKLDKHDEIKDEVEMLYHLAEVNYEHEILESFITLENDTGVEDPIMRYLPKLGEEIRNHVNGEERAAVSWALGNIYSSISKYRDKRENCEKALRAFNEALKVYTPEEYPVQYATNQNNIGATYGALAEVQDTVPNCEKAIKAFEEALKARTLEKYPLDYAMTQNNMGITYLTLARVQDKAENCEKAIKTFEEALKVYKPIECPAQYALTVDNIGTAFKLLSEVNNPSENCEKAIKAFEEALKVRTLEKYPLDYAITQNNMGNTYIELVEFQDAVSNCEKAIKAYKEALKVATLEEYPIQYATFQNNLGNAYSACAGVQDTVPNCEKAIKALDEALRVRTLEEYPLDYAMTQHIMGITYLTLARVQGKAENCEKAIKALEEALKVFSIKDTPIRYSVVQNGLGNTYYVFSEVNNPSENCEKAIKAFEEALKVRTLEKYPLDYAMTQNNMGNVYGALARLRNKAENCEKAIKAYKKALYIFDEKNFFEMNKKIENNLKSLHDFCKNL
jgi:tetratricopeptide (TPR) repeat protein